MSQPICDAKYQFRDELPRLAGAPPFGLSQRHAGLQAVDVMASALLFPTFSFKHAIVCDVFGMHASKSQWHCFLAAWFFWPCKPSWRRLFCQFCLLVVVVVLARAERQCAYVHRKCARLIRVKRRSLANPVRTGPPARLPHLQCHPWNLK